jgi:hypothetical protein
MTMKDTFSALGTVIEIAKRLNHAELQLAVAELKLALADSRSELAEAKEDVVKVRKERDDLAVGLATRKKIVREGNVYKLSNPPEGYSEGPYCLHCFDTKSLLVTLITLKQRHLYCPECKERLYI